MALKVSNGSRVTEGHEVSTPYLNGMVGAVPDHERVSVGKSVVVVDLCALLADAIDATGQRKVAAQDMGISEPVLSKQLGRVDNAAPRLDRVSGLSQETLADFGQRILAACGKGDPRVQRRQAAEDVMRVVGKFVALALEKSA